MTTRPQPAPDDRVHVPTRTLVAALIRADGTIDTGELYAVAPLLDMTDQQVRLCVKRLVAEGRFTQEGRGRRAILRATAATERALAPDVEFVRHAFRQDGGLAPWDGTWHLVAFAVPEPLRAARDALREFLGRVGGAAVQGGLYVCANAWEPVVDDEVRHLGLRDHVTMFTTVDLRRGDERDPVALANALWPLGAVADGYHRLVAVAEPRLARLRSSAGVAAAEVLTIAVELAAEFTRAMEPDPLLPPELLPASWPGAYGRELFARCWILLRDLGPPAAPRIFQRYRDILP